MEYVRPFYTYFKFEDLRVYHKALAYLSWVFSNFEPVSESEYPDVIAKLLDKAQMVAMNIAEGSCRSKLQFIFFIKLAKTNIRECYVLTSVCNNLNILSEEKVEESRSFLYELMRMTTALLISLQRPIRNYGKAEDDINSYPVTGQEM
jgi:four helix bundle protein